LAVSAAIAPTFRVAAAYFSTRARQLVCDRLRVLTCLLSDPMSDLTDPRLMYLKGGLFVVAGCGAALTIWLETQSLRTMLLLALSVWCFCRAYYFAFYVIEHYIDGSYRYAGLWSFVRYHRSRARQEAADRD
jgi:hypothetical protein